MTTLQAASSPVSSRAKKCVELLVALVALPHQPHEQPGHDLSAAEAVDCLGRFKIWAGNLGAFQHFESKSSLDYRLRNASKISAQIVDLLDELAESVEDACMIVSNARENRTASPLEARAQDLDTHAIDEENSAQSDGEEVSEIREIFESIKDAINNLFRLSMIIRNNTTRDRYAKAAAAAQTVPFDDRPDISHVEHKFPALKLKGKEWLIARLGKAITQRRQYLRYCRDHHDKISRSTQPEPRQQPASSIEPKQEMIIGVPADARSAFSKPTSTLAPTQASTLLLTIDQMPEEDPPEESQSQTSYATSREEDSSNTKIAVIKLEDVSGGLGHFECPYCWQIQASKTQKSWKKHVLSDLKPYLCTYEKCELKLFPDHNTWFSHELKDHRREWSCYFCSHTPFSSATDYQNHLQHRHSQSFTEDQFSSLLEMSQRPIVKVSPAECPFCDDWEKRLRAVNTHIPSSETLVVTPNQFKHHVGAHMEQLALFAIPRGYTETGEADSGNAAPDAGSAGSSLPISASDSKTAQELRACEEILAIMMNSDAYHVLSRITDELTIEFQSIAGKLDIGEYANADEFIKDVRRSLRLSGFIGQKTALRDEFDSFWSARWIATMSLEEKWKRWRAKRIPAIPQTKLSNDGVDSLRVNFKTADGTFLETKFERTARVDDLYAYVDCHEFMKPGDYAVVVPEPVGYQHDYSFDLIKEATRGSSSIITNLTLFPEDSLIRHLIERKEASRKTLHLTVMPKSKAIPTADVGRFAAGNREISKAPNLRLTLVSAQNLVSGGRLLPNAIAEVRIDGRPSLLTTASIEDEIAYWNRSFDIKIADDGQSTIAIEVFDEEKYWASGSRDRGFLGSMVFKVGEVIDMANGGSQMVIRDLEASEMYPNAAVKGKISCNLTTDLRIPLVNGKPQHVPAEVLDQAQPDQPPEGSKRGSAVTAEDVLRTLDNSAWGESLERRFTLTSSQEEQEPTDAAIDSFSRRVSAGSQYSLSFATVEASDTVSDGRSGEKSKGRVRDLVSKAFSKVGIDRREEVRDGGVKRENILPAASRTFEDEKLRIIDSCFSKKDSDGMLFESYLTHIRVIENVTQFSSPVPSSPRATSDNTQKIRFLVIAVRKSGQVRIHKARENKNGTFSIGKTWNMDNLKAIHSSGTDGTPFEGFILFLNGPFYWRASTKEEKGFFLESLITILAKYTQRTLPELIGFESKDRDWAVSIFTAHRPGAANFSNRPGDEFDSRLERRTNTSTGDTDSNAADSSSRSRLFQDTTGGTCLLCGNSVVYGGVRTVPCEHTFHQSCLKPWQLKEHTCPHCGTNFPPTAPLITNVIDSANISTPDGSYNLPSDAGPPSGVDVVQKARDRGICPTCDRYIDFSELNKRSKEVEAGKRESGLSCPKCHRALAAPVSSHTSTETGATIAYNPPVMTEGALAASRNVPVSQEPAIDKGSETSHEKVHREEGKSWLAHISLLPSSSQAFPFEKGTTAYQRCLSRGFYKTILVSNSDSLSFTNAVYNAFSDALQGETWKVLAARKVDSQGPSEITMLRQNPEDFEPHKYNKDFLRKMCARVDADDNFLDLYIALSYGTLSWAKIKSLPPSAAALEDNPGIESCWEYNSVLDGEYELFQACRVGSLDGVQQKLREFPEKLNAKDSTLFETPLHIASKWNQSEVVKLLLDTGCNLNSASAKGDTALHLASRKGYEDIVGLILEAGGTPNSVNALGNTPLHDSIENGHVGTVRVLLRSDADPFQLNSRLETPLDQLMRLENEDSELYAPAAAAARIREVIIAAMRAKQVENLDIKRGQNLGTDLTEEEGVLVALQQGQDLKRTENERTSREVPTQLPRTGKEPASDDDLASQWPPDRTLSWMASNGFSTDWQETFKALQIYGKVFLDLGIGHGGRGNFDMMHREIYPRLVKECSNSGTGWDQSRERKEGKRLRRLIRAMVKGKAPESSGYKTQQHETLLKHVNALDKPKVESNHDHSKNVEKSEDIELTDRLRMRSVREGIDSTLRSIEEIKQGERTEDTSGRPDPDPESIHTERERALAKLEGDNAIAPDLSPTEEAKLEKLMKDFGGRIES